MHCCFSIDVKPVTWFVFQTETVNYYILFQGEHQLTLRVWLANHGAQNALFTGLVHFERVCNLIRFISTGIGFLCVLCYKTIARMMSNQ